MLSEGIEVKRIGDLLIEKGLINPQQLEEALEYQKKYGGRLGWILASLGYIKRLDFYKTLAEHYKLEFIEDRDRIVSLIDPNLIKNFDPQELSTHELIPAKVEGFCIGCLKKMDYPQNKLDVVLLLEEDDTETLEAAKTHAPPINWRFLRIPNSIPKTKPKACNYGLFFARGKYLTIYDAEDIPEPDQLKKAVIAFKKAGNDFICFQAALNYFNRDENFLTKMFTLEYSYWFDYLLPGLYNLKLPIPLGGTSNHFDVEKLREIGAWDPFNTTEDADLGVRAFGRGYKVGVINSTTYEEANARVKNWIRQRSRWIKGYKQTFLVQARNPIKSFPAFLKAMTAFFSWSGSGISSASYMVRYFPRAKNKP